MNYNKNTKVRMSILHIVHQLVKKITRKKTNNIKHKKYILKNKFIHWCLLKKIVKIKKK